MSAGMMKYRPFLRLGPLVLLAGLIPRLALAAIALPRTHETWFVPFLGAHAANPIDPWTSFLAGGGDPAAFPYGFLFLLAFKPATWLGGLIGGVYGAHIGLALSVLFWELVLVAAIGLIDSGRRGALAAKVYWLSPIPIYVGYWHGQLDVFPAAVMALGFCALLHEKW